MANGVKTTLSVREMGKILGLKKVESYYLVHKGYFKTILVEGKMRVVVESFEEWYANQDRYRKADGEPPGEKLRKASWSVDDVASLLSIRKSVVYEIIKRDRIQTVMVNGVMRIPREVFDEWYGKQDRYRTSEDRKWDAKLMENSMTMPDMARLLDVPRAIVYEIIREDNGRKLKIITLSGKKRILTDSFEKWYAGQKVYKKPEDRRDGVPYRPGMATYADSLTGKIKREKLIPAAEPSLDPGPSLEEKQFLTISEAAKLTGLPSKTIRFRINLGEIRALRPSPGHIRIERSELEKYLSTDCPADGTKDDPESREQNTDSEGREP